LLNYSLNDIPNKTKRDRSVRFVKELFTVLHGEIHRANVFAATLCAATTFLAGFVPIAAYLLLPEPLGIIVSLTIVGAFIGVFLVHYRSRRAKVHWRVTLIETLVIVLMAVVASILLGRSI
jgi:VIT1/CCC1 family predicted Fe2+/Mn2+ transporter